MPNSQRTGGSENLRGIHYQLLRSLFHANRILDLELEESSEPRWSKLVLEPRDGGDLQLEAPDAIDVEQMKVRSTPWPLYDVIHEVLPDLYRAFVGRSPRRPIREARFVTDAPRGRWKEAEDFFRSLEPCETGGGPPSARLDDDCPLELQARKIKDEVEKGGLHFTKRGLFLYICHVVTGSEDLSAAPDHQVQLWVWDLLRAFRFEQANGEVLRDDVLARIRGRVLKDEDRERVLKALLGDFLEKGRDNAAVIARDLLAYHGLSDVQLRDREVLVERGRRLLRQELAQRHYVRDHDVRAARWIAHLEPDITKAKPLVFVGESGKGKSWALYARAQSLAEQGRLVLLVDATVNRAATSEGAAEVFCREIWGHDGHVPLERLGERLRTADPVNAEDWLDLLVDGVQSFELAEQLTSYNWSRHGIRLSFSWAASRNDIPRSVLEASQLEEVADFTTRELHDYLQRKLGDRALQVSYSEGSILCQPLLAAIFCDLLGGDSSLIAPANEFQLLGSYWARFSEMRPLSVAAIAELAAQAPDGRAYPWTMRTLRDSGVDESAALFLVEKGLLRRSSDHRTAGLFYIRALRAIPSLEVSVRARGLLRAEDMETRLAAAQILMTQPFSDALDDLWTLRCELERQEDQDLNSIHGIVDKALAACARNADEWLRRMLRRVNPAEEPVHALVYLLPQMEHGRQLWFELKETIFAKVPAEQERCIAVCLENFRDQDHIEWLKSHVQENSHLGAAARRALFLLEPGRSPDPIEGEATLLGLARGWWLLPHINADPAVAESFIAQTVGRAEEILGMWPELSCPAFRAELLQKLLTDCLMPLRKGSHMNSPLQPTAIEIRSGVRSFSWRRSGPCG